MAASPEGVAAQTVKLKVLYTFDADQKDNHLARWPHSVEVQTCFLDNTTQIGVIDLRTCLEAVTTSSPELITKFDNDYAVYAYDYSEEDTPLVGQGMLSKALVSQDETAEGENEAMITGRVTKGVMGLFSKNAQPTLEVKLRLTPVATFPQQRMRSGSISSQDGRQPQWSQSNDSFAPQNIQRSASPMDASGLETMQRMLSEGLPPRDRNGSFVADAFNTINPSRPTSRPGTPILVQAFNQPQRPPGVSMARTESQVGVRQTCHGRRDSFNSGYYSGEENTDDGPARKRAKTTKVDWPTKSNFNIERQPDSLRVAASTASSVRIHRPIAINPATALQSGGSAEEPVRPPTPIPQTKTGRPRGRPRKNPQSNLVHNARARDSSPAGNAHLQTDLGDTSLSSPEETRARSVSSTPANIPSSPPVMLDHAPPLITSPALPPMLNNHDSGFMSGNLEDLFGDEQMIHFDDFILDKAQVHELEHDFNPHGMQPLEKAYAPVFEEGNEVESAPPARLAPGHKQRSLLPPPRPLSRAQSFTPAPRVSMSSPRLAPAPIPRARQIMEEQRAKGLPPQIPASDPVGRSLHRANTWASELSDVPMSETPEGEDAKAKSKKKVGKEQTKARLETAIASGAMPPYCDNCGAIETPAWRRGYIKTFTCNWDEVETSLGHGDCVYKEPLERNEDGSIKTFKGYKVEKRAGDETDGWVQVCLCNPCGLWFHKQKCPRPKEKWQKKDPKEQRKRRRAPKGPKGAKKSDVAANTKSDVFTPASDDSSPTDTATEAPDGDDNENDINAGEDEAGDSSEPQLPPMPQNMRASSAEPAGRGLRHRHHKKTDRREVQSSPGQGHGSEGVPIEVDLTPKPLRRQLFPSPDKIHVRSDPVLSGAAVKAPSHLPAFVRRSPRLNKTKNIFSAAANVSGTVALTADGKENVVPTVSFEDGLDVFFDTHVDEMHLPPSTPTPKRRSERLFLKTPQREFGLDLSPNIQRSPTFRTPALKQHPHPIAVALLGTAKKDITEMTPFTRSIHEALSDAPEFAMMTPPKPTRAEFGTRSLKKGTPHKKNGLDFPDLPSLKDSSPMTGDGIFTFNFSELTTDQFHTDMHDPFSTDGPMPSSPPNFFNFIHTDEEDESSSLWGHVNLNGHDQGADHSVYPSPEGMGIAPMRLSPNHALRRSPRKKT